MLRLLQDDSIGRSAPRESAWPAAARRAPVSGNRRRQQRGSPPPASVAPRRARRRHRRALRFPDMASRPFRARSRGTADRWRHRPPDLGCSASDLFALATPRVCRRRRRRPPARSHPTCAGPVGCMPRSDHRHLRPQHVRSHPSVPAMEPSHPRRNSRRPHLGRSCG
jgi:hypothetical protein